MYQDTLISDEGTLLVAIAELQNQNKQDISMSKSAILYILQWLFSNTKFTEDISKKVVGGNLAGDLAEVVEGLTDVHGQQVA